VNIAAQNRRFISIRDADLAERHLFVVAAGGVWRSGLGFRAASLCIATFATFGIWGVIVLRAVVHQHLSQFPMPVARWWRPLARSPSPRGLQSAESAERAIGPDAAATIALQRYPNAAVIGIGLPAGPRGTYRVNLREAGDTTSRSGTVVFIDPRSQAILHKVDRSSRSNGDVFLLWQRILHEGGAFGGTGRFVVFLGGLLPPLFVVTGLIMWLRSTTYVNPSRPPARLRRRAGAVTTQVVPVASAGKAPPPGVRRL
jgi:uncharacterized iron-regulated membrane protein